MAEGALQYILENAPFGSLEVMIAGEHRMTQT